MDAEDLKRCPVCDEYKTLAAFPVSRKGVSRRCAECVAAKDRLSPERRRSLERVTGVRRCVACERTLPLASFPENRRGRAGLGRSRRCAECLAAACAASAVRDRQRSRPVRINPFKERRLADLRHYGFIP